MRRLGLAAFFTRGRRWSVVLVATSAAGCSLFFEEDATGKAQPSAHAPRGGTSGSAGIAGAAAGKAGFAGNVGGSSGSANDVGGSKGTGGGNGGNGTAGAKGQIANEIKNARKP